MTITTTKKLSLIALLALSVTSTNAFSADDAEYGEDYAIDFGSTNTDAAAEDVAQAVEESADDVAEAVEEAQDSEVAEEEAVEEETAEETVEENAEVSKTNSKRCEPVTAPIIPDGNIASKDELLAAKSAISDYQARLAPYRACLDAKREAIASKNHFSKKAKMAAYDATVRINKKYDKTVKDETKVAQDFNEAIKAYKSRG